jgi:hypothetical protein
MSLKDEERRQQELADEAKRLGIAEWQLEASRAVGTDMLRDLMADSRRGSIHRPSSILPETEPAKPTPQPKGNGWVTPPQVNAWSPPGERYFDRMMNEQDARDRAEAARELASRGGPKP